MPLTLIVRYMALRPLLYSEVDKSLYLYNNNGYLAEWMDITNRIEGIQKNPNSMAKMDQIVILAQELKAAYIVVDFPVLPSQLSRLPVELIMQNQSFGLLHLFNPD